MFSFESECQGKIPHMTRKEARAHVSELRQTRCHKIHKIREYRCDWCSFWHIGHKPGTKPLSKEEQASYDDGIGGRMA